MERREGGDVFVHAVARGQGAEHPIISRIFHEADTREIRLYLRQGNDRVELRGSGEGGIKVRIGTGAGQDTVHIAPGASGSGTTVYNADGSMTITGAGDVDRVDIDAKRRILWDGGMRPVARPDWGHVLHWGASFSVNSDFGFRPKVELYRDGFGFQKPDFATRSMLALRYSSDRNTGSIELEHIRRDVRSNLHFFARAFASKIERIRYFGQGNETTSILPDDFYDLEHGELQLETGVAWGSEESVLLSVAVVGSVADTDTASSLGTLVSIQRPYGSGNFRTYGFTGRFEMDRRDDFEKPSAGYAIEAGAGFYPRTGDLVEGSFGDVWARARGYVPLRGRNPVLAGRAYAAGTFGTAPFARQPWIGGQDLLRAYKENRFLGDGAFSASVELRWALFSWPLLFVPVDLGLVGFVDAGRVFLDGEQSNTMHTSAGFGFYMAPGYLGVPALESLLVRLLFAWSDEDFSIYFGWGLSF